MPHDVRLSGTTRTWLRRALSCALLAIVLVAGSAGAQDDARILFDRVGDEERIPDGVITAIAQDGRGFLWVGTPEALVRYDGHRFRRYVHDPAEPGSLPGNRIVALMTARDGRLWIGLQAEGVAIYDPDRDRFEPVDLNGDGGPRPVAQVRALAETPDGAVWVGTIGQGLHRIAPGGGVRTYRGDDRPGALPDDRVAALGVDHHGTLWVGTWRGLARWRGDAEGFEPVLSSPGEAFGIGQATVRGIHAARNGNLWIGAQQGQVAMIPAGELGPDRLPDPGRIRRWQADGFFVAAEPGDGRIWLGHAVGIDVFPADGAGDPERIRHEASDGLSLANAEVRGLLVDRTRLVWVGTFGGGLQRANPANHALVSRRFDPETDAPLRHLNALTVAEARDGGLWAGISQQGVVRLAADLRIAAFIPCGDPVRGIPGRQPSALAEGADGSLWVATEVGIHVRASASDRFETVTAPEFAEGAAARRLWPRADGSLWVATGDGLFLIDAGRAVRRLGAADGGRIGGIFNAVVEDAGGSGWAGGSEGLFRIGPDGVLEPMHIEVDGQPVRATVQGLLVDRAGGLWVDADGLLRVVAVNGAVAMAEGISRRHGFPNVAYGANLLEDRDGRIWTHRFVYDPARDLLLRLGRADGVQVGTGWFRAYARLSGGRFAFGATEGILIVDPERFRPEADEQPLAFTELRVDGRPRPVGARPAVVEIAPDERNFSLEFAALDFGAPDSRRYRYRLDGVDGDWLVVDSESRIASYGGLWPGDYRLRVQGSRRIGGWGDDVLAVDIRVEPRWWQSTGGLVAILGGAFGLVLLFVWQRERNLRAETLRLEREVEGRTVELRALSTELARRIVDLHEASLADPLTGLRNRRFVMQALPAEVERVLRGAGAGAAAREAGRGFVLFLVDIDGFKSINDRYGHGAGDAVLRQFASRLKACFREHDDIVRWGGEEFLVIGRDLGFAEAAQLAARVRAQVAAEPFVLDDGTHVTRTCCIGFAPFPFESGRPRAHGWEVVVEVADRALLAAKRLGRDAWIGLAPAALVRLDGEIADWFATARVRSGEWVVASGPASDPDRIASALAGAADDARPGGADGATNRSS